MKIICIVLACAVFVSSGVYAQISVIANGDNLGIDTSKFPPDKQKAYLLMKQKCSQCHTIDRVITAVQTRIAPLSKTPFSPKQADAIVQRMYQKQNSQMSEKDATTILLFLHYLLKQR